MTLERPNFHPVCGECCVLSFYNDAGAVWNFLDDVPPYDDELAGRRHGLLQTPSNMRPMPPAPLANVFDEIARDDSSYRSLGNYPIPHAKVPNLFLLRYETFSGRMSFQPCATDIDRLGIFNALQRKEEDADVIFTTARTWTCTVQAKFVLPKDIRWVLTIIFNLAMEMLQPNVTEDDHWFMRHWLMFWYDLCDRLFQTYNIEISTPTTDWFVRPTLIRPVPIKPLRAMVDDRNQGSPLPSLTNSLRNLTINAENSPSLQE